jgi:hypothetical protein
LSYNFGAKIATTFRGYFPGHHHNQVACLIVVEVDRSRACSGITNVLLDGGLGPAAKRRPVTVGWVVVVMRVPQRVRRQGVRGA